MATDISTFADRPMHLPRTAAAGNGLGHLPPIKECSGAEAHFSLLDGDQLGELAATSAIGASASVKAASRAEYGSYLTHLANVVGCRGIEPRSPPSSKHSQML